VIVVGLFVALRGGGDEPLPEIQTTDASGTTPARFRPTAATPKRLEELSNTLKRRVYWVGPEPRSTYELTQTSDGQVYVRYLVEGVKVGDPRPNFLTVGTYPQNDPLKTVTRASKRPGARVEQLPGGGLAVANRSRPSSWYLAYPDGEELIEVYSPKPARARELVRADRVKPVKG